MQSWAQYVRSWASLPWTAPCSPWWAPVSTVEFDIHGLQSLFICASVPNEEAAATRISNSTSMHAQGISKDPRASLTTKQWFKVSSTHKQRQNSTEFKAGPRIYSSAKKSLWISNPIAHIPDVAFVILIAAQAGVDSIFLPKFMEISDPSEFRY